MKLGLFLIPCVVCGAAGCGYHSPVPPEDERLSVALAPLRTPDLAAEQELLAGARAELGREGALADGSGYARLVVELVRVDEVAAGIQASPAPLARGSAVGVTARGWIVRGPGAPPERETGDVRRVETVAQGADPRSGSYAFDEAARAAANRVGRALVLRIFGIAEPGVEPM